MLDNGIGIDKVTVNSGTGISDKGNWKPHWKIEKYDQHGNLYACEEFDGNMLLIEGTNEFMKAACGLSATPFNAANCAIGVGNSTIPTTSNMTGLQGTSKAYKLVDATYPQVVNNTMIVRATFGPGVAAFQWNEFTIANGTNEATAKNLNRKVEPAGAHGTKGSLDTWVVSCSITIS